MSAPTLTDFRAFLRIDHAEMNAALELALAAAKAEAESFIGGTVAELWPVQAPGDVRMAILLLGQTHADAGTPQEHEYRRTAAQHLLRPHRQHTGIGELS